MAAHPPSLLYLPAVDLCVANPQTRLDPRSLRDRTIYMGQVLAYLRNEPVVPHGRRVDKPPKLTWLDVVPAPSPLWSATPRPEEPDESRAPPAHGGHIRPPPLVCSTMRLVDLLPRHRSREEEVPLRTPPATGQRWQARRPGHPAPESGSEAPPQGEEREGPRASARAAAAFDPR